MEPRTLATLLAFGILIGVFAVALAPIVFGS